MKQLFFILFLFISFPVFSQRYYLTGSDSVKSVNGNNWYEVLKVNLSDSSDSQKDTVKFEVYVKAFDTWVGARMKNIYNETYVAYDSTLILTDGSLSRYELVESYYDAFRVKRRNRTATKRLGVELIQIKTY